MPASRELTSRWPVRLPLWAASICTAVAVFALVYRRAWPTLEEALLAMTSVACIVIGLRLPSRAIRIGAALTWMLALSVLRTPTPPRSVGYDFGTFYSGAMLLFERQVSPYAFPGTTAFPFPSFPIIWLLSLAGRLPESQTFLTFLAVEILLLMLAWCMIRRVRLREALDPRVGTPLSLLEAALLLHPAIIGGLLLGNTAALAGSLLALAVWCWRTLTGRPAEHATAVLLCLACMVKPQLLMVGAFFLLNWILGVRRRKDQPLARTARIGALLVPWWLLLVVLSVPLAHQGFLRAYLEFPGVAARWHSVIAEIYQNNYAPPAILAKAAARFWSIPVSALLPFLTIGLASLVVSWNVTATLRGAPDTILAFLPWLMSSLLWTSLVWEWYLSLVLVGLLLLPYWCLTSSGFASRATALLFGAGVGLTMVFSSFLFMLGVLLLYFLGHYLRAVELTSSSDARRGSPNLVC